VFDWLGIDAKIPSFDSMRVWACRVGVAQLEMLVKDGNDRIQAYLSKMGRTRSAVQQTELRHLIDRLRKLSVKQRREVPGLSHDRADIIVPGLAVIDRIMRRFKVNLIQVHAYGVRDGLLLSLIERMQGNEQAAPPDDLAQIERFAKACGIELDHARHSAKLATEIYAGLCDLYELDPADSRLLDTAARMQDVGYLINYESHHKHSYYPGLFTRRIANR